MTLCSDNIAVIPARKDSKRLPGKNLLKIRNETLIEIAVKNAEESGIFNRICVTSDFETMEMFPLGIKNNVEILKRDKSLCLDESTTDELIADVIFRLKLKNDDVIIILQPTSALRKAIHIKEAFGIFNKTDIPVISVTNINNLLIENEYGYLNDINKGKYYFQNGAIYIFKVSQFNSFGKIPNCDLKPYYMNNVDSLDIDYEWQYLITKILTENEK